MARESIPIVKCDRCGKTTKNPFDASVLKSVETGLVAFEDLCPKCNRRVKALEEEIANPKKVVKKVVEKAAEGDGE